MVEIDLEQELLKVVDESLPPEEQAKVILDKLTELGILPSPPDSKGLNT